MLGKLHTARNSLASVPVYSLPAEILINVFHLVLSQQPCLYEVVRDRGRVAVRLPKYPDTLSHVCSRWRRMALASHGLWSHIDIALSCPLSKGFHDQAEAYAGRAHPVPLDIHFVDVSGDVQDNMRQTLGVDSGEDYSMEDIDRHWDNYVHSNNPKQFAFLSFSTACRIRSLRLLVHGNYHPIHSRALEYCLTICTPGSLSELIVDIFHKPIPTPDFLESDPDWRQPTSAGTRLRLSEQQLESAWRSVTHLDVGGIYPRWSSAAYHGLTDLRLGGEKHISELDLFSILRSSPGLRIIHCGLTISDEPRSNADLTPASLQELEALEISAMRAVDVRRFLSLLQPGPKPLQFTFCGNPTSTILADFFARSNVQHLRLSPKMFEPELEPEMFYLPARLRVLRIDGWGWWGELVGPAEGGKTPPTRSDTVYMLNCDFISPVSFRNTVAKLSPQRLILWECGIGDSKQQMKNVDLAFLESTIGSDIFQLCSSIECPTSPDPHPLQDELI